MYFDKIKTFLKQLNIKDIVLLYMLVFSIMPMVPRATSRYLTTYFYMLVVSVAVLFIFATCRLSNVRKFVLLLLPFVVYEVMVMVSKNSSDILLAGYQLLLFIVPVCVGFYLVTNRFMSGFFAAVMAVCFCITCITTTIGCSVFPDAARVLASTATSQDATAVMYDRMNIGGYNFVYPMVMLYPYVVLAFKMKRLHFIPMVIFTVLAYVTVIYAAYTYAMLLLMMSTLLFFIRKDISVSRFFLLLAVFAVTVLLFRTTIAALLNVFGDFIGNSAMTDRINALFLGKDAVEGFDDDRAALYWHSINLFWKNPLFGALFETKKVTGGHSFILDNLALYGLVGGGLMMLMYRGIFRVFVSPLRRMRGYCFVLWAFFQTILLSFINTGMWQNNLCFYSPILLCAIYGQEVYLQAVEETPSPLVPVTVLQRKVTRE